MDPEGIEDLLRRIRSGDVEAQKELFPKLYRELHSMARGWMQRQASPHTLQATALVNEVYLKLFRDNRWKEHMGF